MGGSSIPVRDLVGSGVVVKLNPSRVVLPHEPLELSLVDVAVVEKLVDHIAVLNQHVSRRNLRNGRIG